MTGPADRPAAIRDAGPEDREAVAALWSACLLVHGLEPRPAAFDRAWPEIASLGFDERFRRLWRFYLAYCEAGFRSGCTDVRQFELAHAR